MSGSKSSTIKQKKKKKKKKKPANTQNKLKAALGAQPPCRKNQRNGSPAERETEG